MTKETMDKAQMEELLHRAQVGHLATAGPGGPYLVPLHFIYQNENIYFHCGLKGRKLTNIKKDPRVCFQVEEMTAIIPHQLACKYNTRYTSVMVEGRAEMVEDEKEKLDILKEIANKYKKGAPAVILDPQAVSRTLVIKVVPASIAGKQNV